MSWRLAEAEAWEGGVCVCVGGKGGPSSSSLEAGAGRAHRAVIAGCIGRRRSRVPQLHVAQLQPGPAFQLEEGVARPTQHRRHGRVAAQDKTLPRLELERGFELDDRAGRQCQRSLLPNGQRARRVEGGGLAGACCCWRPSQWWALRLRLRHFRYLQNLCRVLSDTLQRQRHDIVPTMAAGVPCCEPATLR